MMKCDELKPLVYSINDFAYIDETAVQKNFENPHDHAVYKATEVDAAIAELKQKIESVQASMYVDVVDANMENRKLRRALWLERAERADDRARIFYFNDLETMLDIDGYSYDYKKKKCHKKLTARYWRITWLNVERKCRAKAEEYK